MRRRFERTVGPLLVNVALPYLDHIHTVEDMIPWIKRPLPLGFALHFVGRLDEARPVLKQERDRLSSLGHNDREVAAVINKLEELLGTM
ncbi:MAG: hypothetical protein WD063_18685 [Pirellulales bacterium]